MRYTSGERIEPGLTYVRNYLTLNEGNSCVGDESYMYTADMVQVATYVYYKYLKLVGIDLKNEENL